METLTQTFKALSDPTRIRILYLLQQQPSFCVCELVDRLQISQSTVSRHLSYLKNSGLVNSWRQGVWMHYALIPEALSFINFDQIHNQLDLSTLDKPSNATCNTPECAITH